MEAVEVDTEEVAEGNLEVGEVWVEVLVEEAEEVDLEAGEETMAAREEMGEVEVEVEREQEVEEDEDIRAGSVEADP